MSANTFSPVIRKEATRLNSICPYFTMFPLDFPLDILKSFLKKVIVL